VIYLESDSDATLVLDTFLDHDRIFLRIGEFFLVIQIEDDLLAWWQGRRVELKSQHCDL
jgi:hypothetical protein